MKSKSWWRTAAFIAFLVVLTIASLLIRRYYPTFLDEYHWYVVIVVFLLAMGLKYIIDKIDFKR